MTPQSAYFVDQARQQNDGFTARVMSPIVAAMKITPVLLAMLLLTANLPAAAADRSLDAAKVPALMENGGYFERARELVINALALIGVRYKFGGTTPDDGFDCSGLVGHVFREVAGLILPRDSQALSKVGNKIDKTELEPGDLVFFNTRRQPFSHVGIYIGEQRFVHAPSRGRDVEVVNMSDRYWHARYNGARRVSF